MTLVELVTALTAAGCRLMTDGEQLRVQDPHHALTDALRQAIRQHKTTLLALIEQWEERAALMEFEGGLSREQAESQAWVCLQGEAHTTQTASSAG